MNQPIAPLRGPPHRYLPRLLALSSAADERWLRELLEMAPTPPQAVQRRSSRRDDLLCAHGIQRVKSEQVRAALAAPSLAVAPDAAEFASERALRSLADRWLAVLVPMLRHRTSYDPG